MRIEQDLQVINAIAQKNFNPKILESYTGFCGIGRGLTEYDYYKKLNAVTPKQKNSRNKGYYKNSLFIHLNF